MQNFTRNVFFGVVVVTIVAGLAALIGGPLARNQARQAAAANVAGASPAAKAAAEAYVDCRRYAKTPADVCEVQAVDLAESRGLSRPDASQAVLKIRRAVDE